VGDRPTAELGRDEWLALWDEAKRTTADRA
jgi:hypothetical protein